MDDSLPSSVGFIRDDPHDGVPIGEAVENRYIGETGRHTYLLVIHSGLNDGVHPAGPQLIRSATGLLWISARVSEDHRPSKVSAGVENAVDHGHGIGRRKHLLPQDPESESPFGAQTSGQRVPNVPQLLRGIPYPLGGTSAHTSLRLPREHQGGSRGRDTRLLSNLCERDHSRPSCFQVDVLAEACRPPLVAAPATLTAPVWMTTQRKSTD